MIEEKIKKHNDKQRNYYEKRTLKQNWRMLPSGTKSVSPYITNHLEKLIQFGKFSYDKRVLDVGCGMGKYTIPLAQKGYNIEGLDLSPVLLETLKTHCSKNIDIPTHCIDILNLPDSFSERYDIIMGSFMLHHLIDLSLAFKQLNSLLKQNGKVVFIDVNPFCPLYYLQITLSPSLSWSAEKGILQLTSTKIRAYLKQAGFNNIQIIKFGISPPVIRNLFFGKAIDSLFDAIPFLKPFAAFQMISAERI